MQKSYIHSFHTHQTNDEWKISQHFFFACQNPTRFEEVFEDMISFLEHTEHWENTEVELATRGVWFFLL